MHRLHHRAEICRSNGARARMVDVIDRIPLAAGREAEPSDHGHNQRAAPGEAPTYLSSRSSDYSQIAVACSIPIERRPAIAVLVLQHVPE
jgi:hypothetical protein